MDYGSECRGFESLCLLQLPPQLYANNGSTLNPKSVRLLWLRWCCDKLQAHPKQIATLSAVPDTRRTPKAMLVGVQLNDSIHRYSVGAINRDAA
jgi:hypothetical protein